MKILFCLLVMILNGVSRGTYAFDIERLSSPQVEVLLKHQARRDWGDDLLQSFPESKASEEWRGLPATLFPALLSNDPNKDLKPFNEWCVRHIATAKAQHRYGTMVDALSRSRNANSSNMLAARLSECAASEEIPPILRLSALSAIVNSDRDLVIESLLVFCLNYVNEIETLSTVQLDRSTSNATGADPLDSLSSLAEDVLAVLRSERQTQVIAEYILIMIDAASRPDSPAGINNVGPSKFVPPFLLKHGDPERVFRISVDRVTPDGGDYAQTSQIVISERGVLNSYRTELLPGTVFIAATMARHELFRFVDRLVSRVEMDRGAGDPFDADYEAALDLLLSRFLQIDDVSIMFRLTPLLQDEVNTLLDDGPDQVGARFELANAILAVLRSLSAEPKRQFGVSVVDVYDSMLQLRQAAEAVEKLVAAARHG